MAITSYFNILISLSPKFIKMAENYLFYRLNGGIERPGNDNQWLFWSPKFRQGMPFKKAAAFPGPSQMTCSAFLR